MKKIGLKNLKEWQEFRKSNRPLNIPANPNTHYKNKGWKGYGAFLGNGNKRNKLNAEDFFGFEHAKAIIEKVGLKNTLEWNEYKKAKYFNNKIPRQPQSFYKDKGWKGWGDFLGNGNVSNSSKNFRSFNQYKKFFIELKLKTIKEFKKLKNNNEIPHDIPSNPNLTYKNKGWTDWSDFLGTIIIAPQDKQFYNYEQAKEYIKTLNIKTSTQWGKFKKQNILNAKMPRSPRTVYLNKGWKGWADFLGKKK